MLSFRPPLRPLLPKLLSTGIAICKKCFYRCLGICPGWVAASLRDADLHARLPPQQPRARLPMHPLRAAENNGPSARCAPCAGADGALPALFSQSARQRGCAGLVPTREARARWELGHRGTPDGVGKLRRLGFVESAGSVDLLDLWPPFVHRSVRRLLSVPDECPLAPFSARRVPFGSFQCPTSSCPTSSAPSSSAAVF